jgi:hypothetical protein
MSRVILMTADQVNPTPKARFQAEEANIKAHHELLQSPAFQKAEDLALMNYNRQLAFNLVNAANPQESQVHGMVNGWKMAGVQEFLAEFHNLAEKKITATAPGLARTLDHKN